MEPTTNNTEEKALLEQTENLKVADPEFAVAHHLEHEWTLWFDQRQNTGKRQAGDFQNYESNLIEIGTFNTVEQFWAVFNHLAKPSQIPVNANFHFFKKGIKPMWEDDANRQGGKWIVSFKNQAKFVDECWEYLLLALIGEMFEQSEEICGCVFSRRKAADRIALWNRQKDGEDAVRHLGEQFRDCLGFGDLRITFEYQQHSDAMKSTASYTNKAKMTL
eukprot:GCRY01000176.1.p1 GENE.GCRY01000176.1~~GCRY01000176.1.p1  ORF type:complete len:219 (-),score=27.58 GCRY01000176.1:111-767(-)